MGTVIGFYTVFDNLGLFGWPPDYKEVGLVLAVDYAVYKLLKLGPLASDLDASFETMAT